VLTHTHTDTHTDTDTGLELVTYIALSLFCILVIW